MLSLNTGSTLLDLEADNTLQSLARAAVPGGDKDSAVRLKRAMWLSRARKGLAATLANAYHYVVTTKHRLIVKALAKERGDDVDAYGIPLMLEPFLLPEDIGAFGGVDENGIDQPNSFGGARLVESTAFVPPVTPAVTHESDHESEPSNLDGDAASVASPTHVSVARSATWATPISVRGTRAGSTCRIRTTRRRERPPP